MEGVRILTIISLLVFLIGFVSSNDVQTLGQIKQGDSILLKQNCINVSYVNITSISVDGHKPTELIVNTISMNLISDGYQTYLFSNSSLNGQYIVTGICDENGISKAWSYNYFVTSSGTTISGVMISIYIFFLLICLTIMFLSIGLIKKNKMSEDKTSDQELYQMKKTKEFSFYIKILKRKFWIIGVFGVYLSFLLFTVLLNQLVYNLGLSDLNLILKNVVIILSWMLIPFIVFWIGYIIVYFFTATKDILKYQFGGFKR